MDIKKTISLVLSAVLVIISLVITYEAPPYVAGRGWGQSQTVNNLEDLSTLSDNVMALKNSCQKLIAEGNLNLSEAFSNSDIKSVTLKGNMVIEGKVTQNGEHEYKSTTQSSMYIAEDGQWIVDGSHYMEIMIMSGDAAFSTSYSYGDMCIYGDGKGNAYLNMKRFITSLVSADGDVFYSDDDFPCGIWIDLSTRDLKNPVTEFEFTLSSCYNSLALQTLNDISMRLEYFSECGEDKYEKNGNIYTLTDSAYQELMEKTGELNDAYIGDYFENLLSYKYENLGDYSLDLSKTDAPTFRVNSNGLKANAYDINGDLYSALEYTKFESESIITNINNTSVTMSEFESYTMDEVEAMLKANLEEK